MKLPARGSLLWRLYVLGMVQLVLLATAVVAVGYAIRPPRPDESHEGPPERGALAPRLEPAERGPRAEPGEPGPRAGPGEPGPRRERRHRRPSPIPPLLTFFFSGLVIVGVGSWLTLRWLVRPLARLSGAARSLGSGNLKARTGLTRGDEIGEVARAFDDMAERVEGLLLAEKELLANVSHELRTPLARIRVALDLAAEGDAEAARGSLAEIGVDLAELEGLIDDVLTATRVEMKMGTASPAAFALHLEEIAPAALAQRACERFRSRHPDRPLELRIEADLAEIEADPVLVRRVLENLLENAHKYSPETDRPIELSVARSGERVAFAVADRGIGIPPEDLPLIFKPFFRGERSRARKTGGVGLGLTLAKRIVEAHGGSIEVTSRADAGTTVRVELDRRSGAV